jgi:hypothetical protein
MILSRLALGESRTTEFKGPMNWECMDKLARAEVAKDIIALANWQGGEVIIGVSQIEGRLLPTGLSAEDAGTWDSTKINQFVNSWVAPPINTSVSIVDVQGKLLAVVSVPPFPNTPHITIKGNEVLRRATLYMRSSNNESAPVESEADMSGIIERAMLNRRSQLLEAITSIIEHGRTTEYAYETTGFERQVEEAETRSAALSPFGEKYDGFMQLIAHPDGFDHSRFPINDLESAINQAASQYGPGWAFLDLVGKVRRLRDGLESSVVIEDQGIFRYWQGRKSGLLFQQSMMWEDSFYASELPAKFASIDEIVRYIALAMETTTRYFQALGLLQQRVNVKFQMNGAEGRQLRTRPNRVLRPGYAATSSPLIVARSYLIEDLVAHQIDYSDEIIVDMLRQFNWENPVVPTDDVREILRRNG